MIRIIVIIILIELSIGISYSQKISDYELVQSKGKIPEDFLVKSSATYKQSTLESSSTAEERKFEKKARNQFLLKSSFDIRELLYSGKIIFNDTLSAYINKVADKLLENDPVLRSKLRFYIVQSPVVNAFTTNSGQIFINMGLLAYLRNESQLAFILAHEIMHYKNKHVLKSYVETQKILYRKGEYRWNAREDDVLTRNRYSRELESEADLAGYEEILKNTAYTTKDLPYLFEVLKYADLPYKHEPIDLNLFYISNKLPDDIKMNTDISIKERTDNDSTSTHPAPDRRNNSLKQKYEKISQEGKSEYLVSKEGFEYCRNTARMHLPFMYLSRNNFEKTIYYSALISQEYPDSKYLKDLIGKGLYGYTLYRSAKGNTSYDGYDGGIKRFSEWLNKLNDMELHLIVFNYFTKMKAQYPNDSNYDVFISHIARNMIQNERYTYTKIYNDYLLSLNLQSTERIKSDNFSVSDAPFAYFYKLVDSLLLKGTMKILLEDAVASIDKEEKENTAKLTTKGRKRMLNKYGACMGIDSLVIVNPDYEKIDQRKKKSQRYVASEAAQLDLNKKIEVNAGLNNVNMVMIDDHMLSASDVGKYNDLAMLTNWFNEKLYQVGNDVELGNLNPELVKQLKDKYGTRYFAWTGFQSLHEKKSNVAAIIVFSTIYFPALPFAAYYLIRPKYNTYHYFILFDIETGQPVFVKSQYIKKRDRGDLLNSSLYDTFYQIKTKKK